MSRPFAVCAILVSIILILAPVTKCLHSPIPPKPVLKSIPLPAKLAGGLFLFQTSVKKRDKSLSQEMLRMAEEILRKDPLIGMELGPGLEAGGIFSSSSSIEDGVHQLVMEFQINGGNSWAQCQCHGLKFEDRQNRNLSDNDGTTKLVSLSVSNMDAAFNGGWVEVAVPRIKIEDENESDDDKRERERERVIHKPSSS